MTVTGSTRGVFSAAYYITRIVNEHMGQGDGCLPCRLVFNGSAVSGKLHSRPNNPDLYNLFESDASEHVYAVASVSRVDVAIEEAHVDAAVDDAVFLHGGAAGTSVDAWIAADPRMLFAWGLSCEHVREVLSSLEAMVAAGSDDDDA